MPPESYEIAIFPKLNAGSAGWSTYVIETGPPIPGTHGKPQGMEGISGGSAPASGARFITGVSEVTGNSTEALSATIVDSSVARVRFPHGQVIVPTASAGLPFGWKAVVALVPVKTRRIATPGRHGTKPRILELRFPLDAPLTPIGPNGATLPINTRSPFVGVPAHALDPQHAQPGVCMIRETRKLAGLWVGPQRVVKLPAPRRLNLDGRAFLDCAQARYSIGTAQMVAAVLVDDENPQRPAPPLPSITSHNGNTVIGAVTQITARREGARWLVVQGGTTQSRAKLITALQSFGPT